MAAGPSTPCEPEKTSLPTGTRDACQGRSLGVIVSKSTQGEPPKMRKIEREMNKAIAAYKEWRKDNTSVVRTESEMR